jgi:hypothetical protein
VCCWEGKELFLSTHRRNKWNIRWIDFYYPKDKLTVSPKDHADPGWGQHFSGEQISQQVNSPRKIKHLCFTAPHRETFFIKKHSRKIMNKKGKSSEARLCLKRKRIKRPRLKIIPYTFFGLATCQVLYILLAYISNTLHILFYLYSCPWISSLTKILVSHMKVSKAYRDKVICFRLPRW